jgi:hypothetical protein
MTWLLAYLLTGFVLRFIATDIMLYESELELGAFTIICAIVVRVYNRP